MTESCLSPEELEQLAHGNDVATWSHSRAIHLQQCASCREHLARWQADGGFLEDLRQALHPAGLPLANPTAARVPAIDGYEIVREIHRGGQGVVYEAIQLSAARRVVAVKVLLDGAFASARSRWRFEREVKLVASLKHPNIVTLHDSGIAQDRYYFAMDYVRGKPLDAYVQSEGMLLQDTIRLFALVCDAVAYAHNRGIIHRDLKPSNILVNEDGVPYVLDFGLAKAIGEEMMESQHALATVAGQVMGTLRYMSPEQTKGDLNSVDTRMDVYALGVILYELITKNMPYETGTVDITTAVRNIREVDPQRPSKLRKEANSEIDAIVLKAMEKEADRRYQSAGELLRDLQAWLAGQPVLAKSASSLYMIRKLAVRNKYPTMVLGLVALITIGFGAATFHAWNSEKEKGRELKMINAQFSARERDRDETIRAVPAAQRGRLLALFLVEWEADRIEGAKNIHAMIEPTSAEYAVAAFLMDDSINLEQLTARLSVDAAPLALFATAERHWKAGHTAGAKASFEEYLKTYGGDWRVLAETRLAELSTRAMSQ